MRFSEHNLSSCSELNMWRLLRKVSAPGMFFFVLDPWSSVPVAYSPIRPKSQIFNIGHDYALWIRNFTVMMNKPENLDFELWPNDPRPGLWPKFQNSNIRHDGILSIRNFMLMMNNHFARFQLPGKLLKTKKMCSLFSWQHAISYLFSLAFKSVCL
jgi:hypothetical protein